MLFTYAFIILSLMVKLNSGGVDSARINDKILSKYEPNSTVFCDEDTKVKLCQNETLQCPTKTEIACEIHRGENRIYKLLYKFAPNITKALLKAPTQDPQCFCLCDSKGDCDGFPCPDPNKTHVHCTLTKITLKLYGYDKGACACSNLTFSFGPRK